MCGIAGIWSVGAQDISDRELDRFIDSLAHRGPDDRGVFRDRPERLAFGHRRLSILDLSDTGRQPMTYGNGRYVITYNGEVYNYPDLRSELRGLGHSFRGESDTEVILAAYAQWGEDCQERFNGMWAFAIWDSDLRRLFLSRDRFGVKPLHYFYDGNRFVFASEMKAFLALDWFSPSFDTQAISRALNYSVEVEGTQDAIFAGVKRLLGGHSLTIESAQPPRISRWWNTLDNMRETPCGFEEQSMEFLEIFTDACKIRMRSDVPVATALSGGLDSGAVFCALAKLRNSGSLKGSHISNAFKAFAAVHPNTVMDERKYVDEVLSHTGQTAIYKTMDPLEGVENLFRIVFDFEEIYDQFTTPWHLYNQMRNENFTVSIDGHGGDELLAGYHHYPREGMRISALERPDRTEYKRFRGILSKMYDERATQDVPSYTAMDKGSRIIIYGSGQAGLETAGLKHHYAWDIKRFVDSDSGKTGRTINGIPVLGPDSLATRDFDLIIVASIPGKKDIYELLDDMGFICGKDYVFFRDIPAPPSADDDGVWPAAAFLAKRDNHPWLNEPPAPFNPALNKGDLDQLRNMDWLNRLLYADFHFTLLPTILRNFDRLSMAHGVEIRAPFMDWRLVSYAFSLPASSKLGGGYTKRILREAMRCIMPDKVRLRTSKIGFGSPMEEWIKGPLRSTILDTVSSQDFLESDVWNGPAIGKTVHTAYEKGDFRTASGFWAYFQAAWLLRLFKDRQGTYRAG